MGCVEYDRNNATCECEMWWNVMNNTPAALLPSPSECDVDAQIWQVLHILLIFFCVLCIYQHIRRTKKINTERPHLKPLFSFHFTMGYPVCMGLFSIFMVTMDNDDSQWAQLFYILLYGWAYGFFASGFLSMTFLYASDSISSSIMSLTLSISPILVTTLASFMTAGKTLKVFEIALRALVAVTVASFGVAFIFRSFLKKLPEGRTTIFSPLVTRSALLALFVSIVLVIFTPVISQINNRHTQHWHWQFILVLVTNYISLGIVAGGFPFLVTYRRTFIVRGGGVCDYEQTKRTSESQMGPTTALTAKQTPIASFSSEEMTRPFL